MRMGGLCMLPNAASLTVEHHTCFEFRGSFQPVCPGLRYEREQEGGETNEYVIGSGFDQDRVVAVSSKLPSLYLEAHQVEMQCFTDLQLGCSC